jgi:hypothetical protein
MARAIMSADLWNITGDSRVLFIFRQRLDQIVQHPSTAVHR